MIAPPPPPPPRQLSIRSKEKFNNIVNLFFYAGLFKELLVLFKKNNTQRVERTWKCDVSELIQSVDSAVSVSLSLLRNSCRMKGCEMWSVMFPFFRVCVEREAW